MYTDNNLLTYVLTTAKLDATGQRWIANLANYNFKIFYRSGKSNIDALSRIPWEVSQVPYTVLDHIIAKSTLLTQTLLEKFSHLPNAVIVMQELIVQTEFQLTKAQWREEQLEDSSINSIIRLLETDKLNAYNCSKTDPDDLKGMLCMSKDFFLDCQLLYRNAHFKIMNKQKYSSYC